MKRLIIVSCFLLGYLTTHSQGFIPGFVIDHGGDTLRGLINDKKWDSSPLKIAFRKDALSDVIEYQPEDIRLFTVGGDFYESAQVDVDTSPAKLDRLNDTRGPVFVKSNVFLQIMFNGSKVLALYKDQMGKVLFYIRMDNQYKPLIYKRYIIDQKNKSIGENNDYKGMLNIYLNDCPTIMELLGKIQYNTQAMTRLFKSYYECHGESIRYLNERKDSRIEYGLTLGAASAAIGFGSSGASYDFMSKGSYASSVGPAIGVYFDVVLLRSNRISITNDIFYTSFSITGTGQSTFSVSPFSAPAYMKFDFSYLKTHNMIRYKVLRNGALYVAGGISLAIALNASVEAQSTYSLADTYANASEVGYLGGLGTRWGRINLEGRLEHSTGPMQTPPSYVNRFYMMFRYRLSKDK